MNSSLDILLIDNDDLTVRDALAEACTGADLARVAVAFVKGSGLQAAPALEELTLRGAEVRMIAGVDFQLTDLSAIERFDRPPSSARIYLSAQQADRAAFHPKVYLLESAHDAVAIVGSSNLTGGGLVDNLEANILLRGSRDNPVIARVRDYHEKLWTSDFALPVTESFRQSYHQLQDRRRTIELALRSEADYERAQRGLRAALAEAVVKYSAGRRGRCWLLITSSENYIRCIDGRVWGDEDRGRIAQVQTGDIIFFYVKSPAKYLAAMGLVTREPYTDGAILWTDDERVYPHRFNFELLLRPPRPVPFRPLVRRLELFGMQDISNWGVHLQAAMKPLSAHDCEVLRGALAVAQDGSLVA
jgi:HKD family nuclease